MEKLTETSFIGVANYITRQEDMESLDPEFFTVLIDDLLDFLWEYYLPL